jgi:hypothetical protein
MIALLVLRARLVALLFYVRSSSSFYAAAQRNIFFPSWSNKHSSSFCSVPSGRQPKLPPSLTVAGRHNLRPSTEYRFSLRNHSQSIMNDATEVEIEESGYPVQITHLGHTATIFVRKDESILNALERQSSSALTNVATHSHPSDARNGECSSSEMEEKKSSLALSHIPNECRRGNCLTCSARLVVTTNHEKNNNVHANIDNGLSPTIDTELTQLGYILTCCSYITGPGVTLELDQNNNAWDAIYRRRICNNESSQLGMEAQARLLRRVDEENVGRWKRRMEKVLSDGVGNDGQPEDIFGQ